MKFYTYGQKENPVILLFPGTCCLFKTNFREVIPYLEKLTPGVICSKTVKICGVGESAAETEINLEDIELLDDDDVRLEDDAFRETAHGVDIVAKYSASEILDYTKTEADKNTQGILNKGQENGELQGGEAEDGEETETDAVNGDEEADAPVFSKDDWRLVLINKQHSIPDDYEVTLGSINTIKGSMKCDERIIDELLLMLQVAKEDGITLAICSPYRDYEY